MSVPGGLLQRVAELGARPVLGPIAVALAVALACGSVVLWLEPEALGETGRWAPTVAGLGLGTWIGTAMWERRTRRHHAGSTAIIGGLALSAVVLHHGKAAASALFGDCLRTWNVYHYDLGSKYFDDLGPFDEVRRLRAACRPRSARQGGA